MIASNTEISSCIDWIAITKQHLDYPDNWNKEAKPLRYGMHHYDTAIQYIDGRIELSSSTRPAMGRHVIFSGATIAKLCNDHNMTTFDLLDTIGQGKCSRLDIALDIKYGYLDIAALTDEIRNETHKTRATKHLYMNQVVERGQTLYVGGAKSNTRVRIYDKQAEQETDFAWTRIECQYRHENAASAMDVVNSAEHSPLTIAPLINSFISFPANVDWQIAFGSDAIALPPKKPTPSNRYKWLMETAARALAKEMLDNGLDVLEQFTLETIDRFEELKGEYKLTEKS